MTARLFDSLNLNIYFGRDAHSYDDRRRLTRWQRTPSSRRTCRAERSLAPPRTKGGAADAVRRRLSDTERRDRLVTVRKLGQRGCRHGAHYMATNLKPNDEREAAGAGWLSGPVLVVGDGSDRRPCWNRARCSKRARRLLFPRTRLARFDHEKVPGMLLYVSLLTMTHDVCVCVCCMATAPRAQGCT
jgi:hypothetical protein